MDRSMQPSARALTALSLLAALGSLTAAAGRLGVTRSALSHRIAELEVRLGLTLARKSGRHLSLTEDCATGRSRPRGRSGPGTGRRGL